MENASKALIIAGAILLAILIISLGIMIFNTAKDTISSSGMSQAELSAFNSKFEKYEGSRKGSEIRSMVQEVMANNNSDEASDETRISINMTNGSVATTGTESLVKLEAAADKSPTYGTNFKNTKTYTVSFEYSKGRVAVINVK